MNVIIERSSLFNSSLIHSFSMCNKVWNLLGLYSRHFYIQGSILEKLLYVSFLFLYLTIFPVAGILAL